jgi:ABC-type nickel/cobalt efflux system permease component RcnA
MKSLVLFEGAYHLSSKSSPLGDPRIYKPQFVTRGWHDNDHDHDHDHDHDDDDDGDCDGDGDGEDDCYY